MIFLFFWGDLKKVVKIKKSEGNTLKYYLSSPNPFQ